MLKKNITLSLVCAILLVANLPLMAQIQSRQNDLQGFQSAGKNDTSTGNLRAVFEKETKLLKTEKTFTKADAEKLEKEYLKKQMKKNNFSTAAKVGLGLGIAAAVVLIIIITTRGNNSSPQLGPVQCGTIATPCP